MCMTLGPKMAEISVPKANFNNGPYGAPPNFMHLGLLLTSKIQNTHSGNTLLAPNCLFDHMPTVSCLVQILPGNIASIQHT